MKPLPEIVPLRAPLPLGTKTVWGKIVAVGCICGERYYWLEHITRVISMLPAHMLELEAK